ncbi:unnamed protein product [Coffea canephora]|uniref:Protein kinase domain-containing protein n=1 Tax=Coffea canephora TaxID=49390 RepID=A0A068USJ0_COFCA|nr:unnamed protein product [Coffea canephora]
MAIRGCNDTCGGVTIPYPFGVGPDCALNDSYTIICVDNYASGSKPYLSFLFQSVSQFFVEVLEISLIDQTVTINKSATRICSDHRQADLAMASYLLDGSPFFVAAEHNKLMLVGCGNAFLMSASDSPEILSGCTSICTNKKVTGCYGLNCCQASIPYYLGSYTVNITASQNFTSRTCPAASLVDQKWKFQDLDPKTDMFFPLVLSWAFRNYSDIDGISSCTPKNRSLAIGSRNIPTYYCECRALGDDTWSYHINPYLDDACKNGSSVGAGLLLLMIITLILYGKLKRIYNNKRKEKVFRRMLQQQFSTQDIQNTKLFTGNELSKATDGFNENRILGQGGQGTVYKGMLADGRIVAIKKGKNVGKSRFEEFLNEMVILSQVNHRNVVKLQGCCLQTEVPLLIYEFIPNGTLYNLIHSQNDDEFPFTWNLRLRIATEIAGALAYLHSDVSPISSLQTEEDHVGVSLVESFLKSMNQNSLMTILDPELADERNEEEVILVAELAQRCLNSNGKARPTMKETHRELERAKLSKVDSTIHAKFQDPSCTGKEAFGKSDTTCYTWTIASDTVELASDACPSMFKTV